MQQRTVKQVRELQEITINTDTRDILSHATIQAEGLEDYFLVDIDAHVTETSFWNEIIDLIDNDVIRQMGESMMMRPGNTTALLNAQPGTLYQNVYGRIPHQVVLAEAVDNSGSHRFTELARRSMDAMGIDYQVVFPTPMLVLGMHPQDDIEAAVGRAYNRWLIERILPEDERIKGLLYLPFNSPQAAMDIVRDFGAAKGVIGFTITCTRNRPVHHNQYMKLYAMIEETGKPLAFHSGFHWGDPSFLQLNRFISMHALSFVHYSLIHLTNWVINALPERFPKLKLVWVESGLAWIPFIMQRLDHEFMMRVCEAPNLKRLPSEYIREMYFTSQPLERSNMKLLEATFDAIKAGTQLLFASDWPHWDFDPPSSITTIPFLSEQEKRNILGLNAARLFNLEVKRMRPCAKDVLAARPGVA
ncbi:MAG: amidohydrolase [Hyphomicrobiaceae bacterium]|nr:amidohydrolase [Hyphomicrobiaceae bacterium]